MTKTRESLLPNSIGVADFFGFQSGSASRAQDSVLSGLKLWKGVIPILARSGFGAIRQMTIRMSLLSSLCQQRRRRRLRRIEFPHKLRALYVASSQEFADRVLVL